jgi:hypothetical protein
MTLNTDTTQHLKEDKDGYHMDLEYDDMENGEDGDGDRGQSIEFSAFLNGGEIPDVPCSHLELEGMTSLNEEDERRLVLLGGGGSGTGTFIELELGELGTMDEDGFATGEREREGGQLRSDLKGSDGSGGGGGEQEDGGDGQRQPELYDGQQSQSQSQSQSRHHQHREDPTKGLPVVSVSGEYTRTTVCLSVGLPTNDRVRVLG